MSDLQPQDSSTVTQAENTDNSPFDAAENTQIGYETSRAALLKFQELTKEATPEGSYYLSKGIANIVGKATVFDIVQGGQIEKAEIKNLSDKQVKTLEQLNIDYKKQFSDAGDIQDDKIQKAGTRELNNIQSATTTHLKKISDEGVKQHTAVKEEGDKQLAEITNLGGQILTPQQMGVLPDSRPFLFGIVERYTANGISTTSEHGQLYNNNGEYLLDLIAGIKPEKTLNKWVKPPRIEFIQGDTWHYSEQLVKHAASGNLQNYPDFMLSALMVKNTTDTEITRPFSRRYSVRWSSGYEGASLNVGTPNADKTKINWNTVKGTTANAVEQADAVNITIPAKTTCAITFYNSALYWTNSSGYQFVLRHMLEKMNTFLGNGLEIDIEATLIAAQKVKTNQKEIWGIK